MTNNDIFSSTETIPNVSAEGQKSANVPNLRLAGFNDSWTPTTLSAISSYRKIHRTSTKKYFVSTENILQNFQGIERFTADERVSGDGFNCDDILMGNIRPYLKKVCLADFDGVCNADVLVFKSESVNPRFLHCILANDNFINYVMSSVKGSKMPRGDKGHIMQYPLSIPRAEEQAKIADFIALLNERIYTQNKIIEKLQSQMIAIYHRLFRGTDDAFIKQLKEICTIRKGTQVNGTELLENGRYYFMNGGITPSGYFNSWNTEAETISISEGGNSCGYVQFNTVRFWSGGHCYTLVDLVDCVIPKFLYHYLKAHEEEIMRMRIGTGLPNIQKKDLETLLIYVPTLEKQKHYLKLLEAIEQKITIEQRLLKILKEQKKFLLSNMFI